MITIPVVLTHGDISVYPDDRDCNLFYCIQTTPKIRVKGGKPVFGGLFWTDKADGTMKSTAGIAGGKINFDANLAVTREEEETIAEKIVSSGIQNERRNELLKMEKDKLSFKQKAGAADANFDFSHIPAVGEVRFGTINYTEGSVTLLEENGGDIVAWSSSGGKASGFADNNAAFSLRLAPDGAAIWYKSLKDGADSVGVPIGIKYDLKFLMRIPSLEIRAYAASQQSLTIERDIERTSREIKGSCGKSDTVYGVNVNSVTEKLLENNVINIEIKKGSTHISSEYISQIRESVVAIIQKKIEEIVKSRVKGLTEKERNESVIRILKEEYNSFVELRYTQDDVIEWSVSPQGTIMNFLKDVPKNSIKSVVNLVDLSDPEVSTTAVNVRVSAPWNEAPYVDNVDVDLEIPGQEGKTKSFSFTKDTPMKTWFFRTPKRYDGKVKYTAYAYLKNHQEPYKLSGVTTGDVSVNISKIGLINLKVKPHPNLMSLSGKNKVTSVQVDIEYKSVGKIVFSDSLPLLPEDLEGKEFNKDLGIPIEEPLNYRVTYFFKERETLVIDNKKIYLSEDGLNTVYTPFPFEDALDLKVELPFIPSDEVLKISVDFIYIDEKNEFESSDRVLFSKEDEWESVTAKLVLLDKKINAFKYRFSIYTKDDIVKSDWINAEGEAETIVLPMEKIEIDYGNIGIGTDYRSAVLEITSNVFPKNKKKVFRIKELNMDSPYIEMILPKTDDISKFNYNLILRSTAGENLRLEGDWEGNYFDLSDSKK